MTSNYKKQLKDWFPSGSSEELDKLHLQHIKDIFLNFVKFYNPGEKKNLAAQLSFWGEKNHARKGLHHVCPFLFGA